ncbi:MAG TPA: PKD domain-containing protein, partial [Thermoanaerobaculia bacterium]
GPLALLWNGFEFGLFYQSTDLRIRLQRVGANGELEGAAVVLTPNHLIFPDDELHVIWDPTRGAYLMARTITQSGERGLWLEVIERDGRTRADRQIELFPARPGANPRVAVTANGTIGVFYDHGITEQLTLLRIDASETLHPAIPVIADPGLTFDVHARNNVFGIVRRLPIADATTRTEIRWMALDHTGAVVTGDRQLVTSRGRDVVPVSLRGNENEWALSYVDSPLGLDLDRGELRLHRFSTAGGAISNTLFSPDSARFNALASDPFIWTGASYVTSGEFVLSPSEGSDSYLISHCPIRATASASKNIIVLYDPVELSTVVQGGSGPYRYEWDLGDRNFRTGSPVTHTYLHPGVYTVVVTVTDAAGGTSISTVTVRVVELKKRAVRPR